MDWVNWVTGVTAVVGAVVGLVGGTLGIMSYRASMSVKALDMRLELKGTSINPDLSV